LSDNYQAWLAKGYEVVGVSPDSVASHKKFADKFNFGFNLIADPETKILQAYGVWGEKSMYGKKYMGVLRTTFVINEKGIIEEVFEKVDTKNHTDQIIKALDIK
jgi:peroxiredoxin Q/BCP